MKPTTRVRCAGGILIAGSLIALSFIGSRAVRAQSGAALTGNVTSAEEARMEGVVVSARRDGSNVTVSVVSDKDGKYTFPRTHLATGRHTITMRAVGYDLSAPVSVDVKASGTATADLKLQKTANLASQLSSAEWMLSANGSDEEKDRFAHQLMSCNYCHTLQRVFTSKHTAQTLLPAMQRMVKYYADGTAKSNDNRRGRAAMVQEPGREKTLEENPLWGATPGIPRTDIAAFVEKNNLSSGRTTYPYALKTLPRPKGKATRVIITEYDMPTAATAAHDSDIDSKGILWYTDESAQMFGRFDTKTGTFTEIRDVLPVIPKGQMEGTRDVLVGKDDRVWFPVRVPGNEAVLARYDPLAHNLTLVEGVHGQFINLGGDGFIWAGPTRVDPNTAKVEGVYPYANAKTDPPGPHGGYGAPQVDSQGNPWVATSNGPGGVLGVDLKTKQVKKWLSVPGLRARRGRIDHKTDQFYFAEYLNDKAAMYDIRSDKFQRWDLGMYYTPYTASVADSQGRFYVPSNGAERLIRIDPRTNEIVEYQWPTEFDTKKIAIDPTTKNPVLWFTNMRTARISKVEPLD
jgi:streptogramin lyase